MDPRESHHSVRDTSLSKQRRVKPKQLCDLLSFGAEQPGFASPMNSHKSSSVTVPLGLRTALILRTPSWKWLRIMVLSPSSAADQPGQRSIDHQTDEKASCLSVHLCRDMLAVSVIDLHLPIRFLTLRACRGQLFRYKKWCNFPQSR